MIYRGKEEDGRTEEDTLSKRRKKTHFRTPLTALTISIDELPSSLEKSESATADSLILFVPSAADIWNQTDLFGMAA